MGSSELGIGAKINVAPPRSGAATKNLAFLESSDHLATKNSRYRFHRRKIVFLSHPITEAITLWGLLTILVFKIYNRLNTCLKIDTKRMRVCKNAKYIITSLSFAQFRNSRYHQNQDIISYTFAFLQTLILLVF